MGMKIDDIALHNVGSLDLDELAKSIESRLVLVCPAETSAVDAIGIATESNIPLIIVTTDPARPPHRDLQFQYRALPHLERVVCGVVEPTYLRNALTMYFRNSSDPLLEIVRDYGKDTDQARRNWRHEWLNQQGVALQFCKEGGGHLTTLPCRYHAGAAQTLAIW